MNEGPSKDQAKRPPEHCPGGRVLLRFFVPHPGEGRRNPSSHCRLARPGPGFRTRSPRSGWPCRRQCTRPRRSRCPRCRRALYYYRSGGISAIAAGGRVVLDQGAVLAGQCAPRPDTAAEGFARFISWSLRACSIANVSRPTTAPSGRNRRRPGVCRRVRTPGT
jgi:hypothetical protein